MSNVPCNRKRRLPLDSVNVDHIDHNNENIDDNDNINDDIKKRNSKFKKTSCFAITITISITNNTT